MFDSMYLEWIIQWFTFASLMALGQFSPGPDMILLTRVALSDGRKPGYATALGIATGLTIHAAIAIFAIHIITSQSHPYLLLAIYIVAAMYLLWLAYGLLSSAFISYYSGVKLELDSNPISINPISLTKHYQRGLLCNLLNPKVAIFLAGVVLPFQNYSPESLGWSLILWATIILEGLALWCLWVKLLQTNKLKRWYRSNSYMIDGLFGIAMTALAITVIRECILIL